jgi:diguanylate cyclase (GGDEF)-like protein
MTTLFQTTMDITSHLQLEELLRSMVRRTVTLLYGFCGGVRLIERTESGWEYGPITFWPVDEYNDDLLLALESETKGVVENGRSKVIETSIRTARASSGGGSGSNAVAIIVPMKWEGDVIGVLYVLVDRQGRPLAETDASLLNLLASQAAIAVQNSRLYEGYQALAVTDPLTGLYNRRFFSEELGKEMSRSVREGNPLSLIVLDVDFLKNHNDSRGHLEGDKLLCAIAEILRLVVRESDIACRYGGDEFSVLLPGATETEALQIAERTRSEVESGELAGATISVSLGVATFPTDACDAENLMLMADRRLYAAKALGRNRVCGSKADSSRQESMKDEMGKGHKQPS